MSHFNLTLQFRFQVILKTLAQKIIYSTLCLTTYKNIRKGSFMINRIISTKNTFQHTLFISIGLRTPTLGDALNILLKFASRLTNSKRYCFRSSSIFLLSISCSIIVCCNWRISSTSSSRDGRLRNLPSNSSRLQN